MIVDIFQLRWVALQSRRGTVAAAELRPGLPEIAPLFYDRSIFDVNER
jgi:hypothetical protein